MRIALTDYDPDKAPLFVGLSVTPYVHYKEPATGPHAGDVLRPHGPRRRGPAATDAGGDPQPAAPTSAGREGGPA